MKKFLFSIFAVSILRFATAGAEFAPEAEYSVSAWGKRLNSFSYSLPITPENAKSFESKNPEYASVEYSPNGGINASPALVIKFSKTGVPVEITGPEIPIKAFEKSAPITERTLELGMRLCAKSGENSSLQVRIQQGKWWQTAKSHQPTRAGHDAFFDLYADRQREWENLTSTGRMSPTANRVRIVFIAEAKAPEAEFRIASLSLRDEVQINHQIKTPAVFNTFFRDDGCAEIKWAYPQNIISAKVRLFDEEKKLVLEQPADKFDTCFRVDLRRRGFYRIEADATYKDASKIVSSATAFVAGRPMNESARRNSPFGMVTRRLPASFAMDLGVNHNYNLYSLQHGVERGKTGAYTFKNNTFNWYSKGDDRRFTSHLSGHPDYPSWIKDPKHTTGNLRPPTEWDEYEKIVEGFVRSLKEKPSSFCWQNEPDTRLFDDSIMVESHKHFAKAVKRAYPEAKIAVYCSYGIFPEKIEKYISMGMFDGVDILNTHNYESGSIPEEGFISRVRALKAVLKKNGLKDLPIVISEFGWMSKGKESKYSVHSELDKARYAARAMLLSAAEGVSGMCLFDGQGGGRDFPEFSSYRFDNQPLPQAAAFSTLAKIAGAAKNAKLINFAPDLYCVSFKTPEGSLWAMWTTAESRKIKLPQKPISIVSMCGTPKEAAAETEVSPSPVYLSFDNPNLSNIEVLSSEELFQTSPVKFKDPVLAVPEILDVQNQITFTKAKPGSYEALFKTSQGKFFLRKFGVLKGIDVEFKGAQTLSDRPSVKFCYNVKSDYSAPIKMKAWIEDKRGKILSEKVADIRGGDNPVEFTLAVKNAKRISGSAKFKVFQPFEWSREIPYDFTALYFPYFKNKEINWEKVPAVRMDKWHTGADLIKLGSPAPDFSVSLQCAADDSGIAFRISAADSKHI